MEVKESKEEVGSMKSNASHIFIISPENITVRQVLFYNLVVNQIFCGPKNISNPF